MQTVPKKDRNRFTAHLKSPHTLLHLYLQHSHPSFLVTLNLLSHDCNVNSVQDDNTPLLVAAKNSRTPFDVFKLLLDAGADPNYITS